MNTSHTGHPGMTLAPDVEAPDWLTVPEVAARLRRHPNTIRRWIHVGFLEARQPTPRGAYLIHRSQLEAQPGTPTAEQAAS